MYVSMYIQYSHQHITISYQKLDFHKIEMLWQVSNKVFFVTKCPRVGHKLCSKLVVRLRWYIY